MSEEATSFELAEEIKNLQDELLLHRLEIEALRMSNETYKDLFENANDAIFIVDSNLNYTEVNKKAVELFGFSKKEFLSMKVTDMIPPEQIPRSNEEFQKLRRHGIYEKFVGKQRTKADRWLDVEVSSSAIVQNGKLIGSRDIVRDITERKQAEEELNIYRSHLEDLVDERTAETLKYAHQLEEEIAERKLAEKERQKLQSQLRQKQKIEAIGALAGGIAHDFNNILNAILSYTELSMNSLPPGSNTYKHLEKVIQAVKRAGDLVKQILTFSSRKTDKDFAPTLLQPLIKEESKLIRGTLPDNITLTIDICPDCRTVYADFIQIHQVFMNICTNAISSISNEGGALKISLKEVEVDFATAQKHPDLKARHYARLVFEDNGCGMTRETIERIFEPFFTTKKFGAGTGLGLATVHGIIKAHGGVCVVESEKGRGTTFNIYLPIIDHRVTQNRQAGQDDFIPQKSGTILFVDDEILIAEAAKIALRRFGHQVEIFSLPLEALERFRATPEKYDLVVTDHKMPDMTGAELAQKIFAVRPDIPLVLATGYSEDLDEDRAKQMGISEFIMKPISMTDLARIIAKLINNS